MSSDPARLYQQLLNTGLQNKDTQLYQLLRELIDSTLQLTRFPRSSSGGGPSGPNLSNKNFLTHTDESTSLPNSRHHTAGDAIEFDDSLPNERIVNVKVDGSTVVINGDNELEAVQGGVAPDSAVYLTGDDESGSLPNSRQLLAGVGVLFDDSIANERTIDIDVPPPAGAHIYRNTNQTIANTTLTAISFSHELIDEDDYWDSGNPTRLTANEEGWYIIRGQFILDNTTGAGRSSIFIRKNGSTIVAQNDSFFSSGSNSGNSVEFLAYLSETDYVELLIEINSGGSHDTVGGVFNTYFQIIRNVVGVSTGGGGGAPTDLTYLTKDDESAILSNSYKLIAGTNIVLDDSTPNELAINASGGDWDGIVVKPSNQTVINNATVQADTALILSLDATSVYYIEFFIIYSGNNSSGQYRWEFGLNQNISNTVNWFGNWIGLNTSLGSAGYQASLGNNAGGGSFWPFGTAVIGCDSSNNIIVLRGFTTIRTNSAGTLTYRFALGIAASGREVTTYAGSFLRYKKVA
jgi:hypothetical protein